MRFFFQIICRQVYVGGICDLYSIRKCFGTCHINTFFLFFFSNKAKQADNKTLKTEDKS